MRLLITGAPRAGKTTMAEFIDKLFRYQITHPILHTDEVAHLEWSEASAEVAYWFDQPGPWIIEGVTIPRALRKWRHFHGEDQPPPFDWFVIMRNPRIALEGGQETMRKQVCGLADTMKEWIGERWIEL